MHPVAIHEVIDHTELTDSHERGPADSPLLEERNDTMTSSLLIHEDPLALALRPSEALETTAGDPQASDLTLHRDESVECGVWEVTPGTFIGQNIGFGEHMYVLKGRATITSDDGTTLQLHPGISFVALPGWRGRWQVHETLRKIYVIWRL